MTREGDMAYWICSREQIRTRKDRGLAPTWKFGYSDDYNMGTVRYCNVHREDDNVTRWIAKNWRNPNVAAPNFIQAMVLARLVNWPETLQALGYPAPFNAAAFCDVLAKRSAAGCKIWTSAYTISTCGKRMPKEQYVAGVVTAVGSSPYWNFGSLAGLHNDLMRIDGLGSFLAAQVVADVKNTPGHPLENAPDWHTWCAPGPGSLRGLTVFYGRNITAHSFQAHIKAAWGLVEPLLPSQLKYMHMQDFQNCLCEFSKYIRVKEGDGRARNKYRPG